MQASGKTSSISGAGLFLETCAFYLVVKSVGIVLLQPEAVLPFWLVLLTLGWAYGLSTYVQALKFSSGLRGFFGMSASAISIMILANMNTNLGWMPIGDIVGADAETAFGLVLSLAFVVLVWWRGSMIAQDEITLDTVRASFQWGLVVIFGAVMVDSLRDESIVSGFLVFGFFAVGLVGLSLARFYSEAGDSQSMSRDWWIPIGASVGLLFAAALIVSAVSAGGLDNIAREGLRALGIAGLWVLKPLLLVMGGIAALLVALGNWVSGLFGGGDLTAFEAAQQQLREFHESLEEEAKDGGLPPILLTLFKLFALLIAATLVGWILYRIFRFRRLLRPPGEVEETRESLFSWSRANDDLSNLFSNWWNRLVNVPGRNKEDFGNPKSPRDFYHGLLSMASRLNRPRSDWQTPKEHQNTLEGVLPTEPVDRIVDGFQQEHYGEWEPDGPELERMHRDWTTITEHYAQRHPSDAEDSDT